MAGFLQRMRNVWGGSVEEKSEANTPKSPRTNVWQGVFDPNTNPNMRKGGRSHYDTVDPAKKEPSCWEYVSKSQEKSAATVKEKAFQAMGGTRESPIDAADLRKLFEQEHVENILRMADKNHDGKIDFNEFCEMLRKY